MEDVKTILLLVILGKKLGLLIKEFINMYGGRQNKNVRMERNEISYIRYFEW